jgi:hypothetical protein
MSTLNQITDSRRIRMAGKHSFVACGSVLAAAFVAIAALVVTAAPSPLNGSPNPAPQATGSITGKILFQGTPPERRKLNMSADPVCAARNPEAVLAQDGAVNSNATLPNAFVYLKDVPGNFKPPTDPVVLDQSACMYVPHVLALMVGQPLKIVSSDPTTHNIHFMSTQNPNFNQTQPPGAPPIMHKFAHPEIMIMVHCNEHPWMSAYVAVTSNPFYSMTGADGSFTIQNVPVGEYTLGGWTAAFGTQDQKVTVRAGQSTQASFTFKAQ